jgi:class 3 adenylate cyclase
MEDRSPLPRGTVTFLFTDIEGSTRLLERLGDVCYTAVLSEHHRLLRAAFQPWGGHEIDTAGDSFFVSFPLASHALAAAVAAQRALAAHRWPEGASVRVRMGLHTGEASPADGEQIKGTYIHSSVHRARRISDAGHGEQILLSHAMYELVRDSLPEGMSLVDLGEHRLKDMPHPEHLFQVVLADLPREFPPLKTGGGQAPAAGATSQPPVPAVEGRSEPLEPGAAAPALPSEAAARVALLYKRYAQPDERLLKLLETRLAAAGYQIFIDRHMTIGVEWAREIERQVRSADAVVPLLSAASVQSEMLHYEVQIAHEAAQQQEGKPRLLPVRIQHTDPLPEPLAAILGPLHYTVWEGPADDERLVTEVIRALRSPPPPRAAVPPGKLEPVGGAVPLDSPFYVVRPTDALFRAAMARQDSLVLVKGARQMGKTSLLARGLQQAREAGARVVLTDFQLLNEAHLKSAESLLLTLADWIAGQLDLEARPDPEGSARSGPSMNFGRYLRREVLGPTEAPLVWGLDEVDRLFTCAFASEVFGMFRSWHNARSLDPAGPWSRLTLAIAYAREAHLFITDVNQSPFNVGTRLTLEDFTREQVAELNQRYDCPLRDAAEVDLYYRLVGGHPYLVRRGLLEMATEGIRLPDFEAQAVREEGVFGDHLRRLLVLLVQDRELPDVVRAVIRGGPCPSEESFYRLRSAGVFAGESARDARPRCQLYATYLERHLR